MDDDKTTRVNPDTSDVPEHLLEAFESVGFRILRPLGEGGMAQVYLAEDAELGRQVAIKVLHQDLAESEDFETRFVEEARRVAALEHKNILTVFRAGMVDGMRFIAMQLATQGDLAQLIQNHSLAEDEAATICMQLAEALAHAHEHHIIHRDIKPANVFISETGNPILADFGIAKSLVDTGRTQTGMVIGSPAYMSPEQRMGLEIDEKSDVYALGLVFFEMLTNHLPQDFSTTGLKEELTGNGQKYVAIISKCLAADPQLRPSATELAGLLQGTLSTDNSKLRVVITGTLALAVLAGVVFFAENKDSTHEVLIEVDPPDTQRYLNSRLFSGPLTVTGESQLALIRRGYHGQLIQTDTHTASPLKIALQAVTLPSAEEKLIFHALFDNEATSVEQLRQAEMSDPVYAQLLALKLKQLQRQSIVDEVAVLELLAKLGDDVAQLKLFLAASVQPALIKMDADMARAGIVSASQTDDRYPGYALASHYRALEIMQARGASDFTQRDRDAARDLFATALMQGLDWPGENMGRYVQMACNIPIVDSQPVPSTAPACLAHMRRMMPICESILLEQMDPSEFSQCMLESAPI